MFRRALIALILGLSTLLVGAGLTPVHADNEVVQINRVVKRSSTHRIALVKVWVACSEDTTAASISATLTQNVSGGTQTATGNVTSLGAFECSGEEEQVTIPIRRPTGGYKWRAGLARVSNVVFVTADPSGVYLDRLKGRTVLVK